MKPRKFTPSIRETVVRYAKKHGIVRPRDLDDRGAYPSLFSRLVDDGTLERVGRGVYRLTSSVPLGSPDLILVSGLVPKATIGLVSSLNYHGLTTEIPRAIDLLLPQGMSAPKITYPPTRIFWASISSLSKGVISIKLDGVRIRMTSPAKTVADCFKFRRRVGLDVALEALRMGIGDGHFSPSEFARMAKIDRVLEFTRPYLESLA